MMFHGEVEWFLDERTKHFAMLVGGWVISELRCASSPIVAEAAGSNPAARAIQSRQAETFWPQASQAKISSLSRGFGRPFNASCGRGD